MLRRCVIWLIVLGMLESALACSPAFPEPRELKIEIVQGLGGDCYYKRIPPLTQPDDVWEQDNYWRTEFYMSAESEAPVFSRDYYFYDSIACLIDSNSQKHISHVNETDWLEFVVDGQAVKTYEAIDVVQDGNTLQVDFPCDGLTVLYVKYGDFTFDKTLKRYIYQLELLNNELVRFDLLTGSQIPTEKPLEVLLADAIRSEDLEAVENLLARGADPNKGSVIDGTPLYLAAESRNIEMVRKLLMVGAEAYTQNKSHHNFYEEFIKNTPVYAAAKNGDLDIIELLWGFGADINQKMLLDFLIMREKQSPLDVAILNNHVEIVRYLLEHGAKFSDKTLELAKQSGNLEILELISSHSTR